MAHDAVTWYRVLCKPGQGGTETIGKETITMLTYSQCAAMMATARNPHNGKPIQSNTRLYQRGSDYAVRLHSTDVVTVHPGGTYTLKTGGWLTGTTKERINGWSPARVYSARADSRSYPVWVVSSADDPVTPVKMRSCRRCRGTGHVTQPAWTETYGRLPHPTYEIVTKHFTDRPPAGVPAWQGTYRKLVGQVVRHDTGSYGRLPEPVLHPPVTSECWGCQGSGERDYGSRPMPVIFFDGIRVDGYGNVIDADAWPRLREPAEVTAGKITAMHALDDALRLRQAADATGAWCQRYGINVGNDGTVLLYKVVGDDFTTSTFGPRTVYEPGTEVTASDYNSHPVCGGGLHFWPTMDLARAWDSNGRYLLCAVEYATLVPIQEKAKARTCRVLFSVTE